MAQVLGLPKCVAIQPYLRAGDVVHYLCTVQREGDAAASKFGEVRLDDGGLTRPHVRFYLEPSKKHEGLVHVRCSNNKYWMPEEKQQDSVIVFMGTADEPDEDLSKPSGTLFEPIIMPTVQKMDPLRTRVSFFHPGLQQYVQYVDRFDKPGEPKERRSKDFFHIFGSEPSPVILIDLSQIVILPQYVAFKGNNGKYLQLGEGDYLEFTASEVADARVVNTVISNNDGTVCLKCNHNGLFWRIDTASSPWHGGRRIRADATRGAFGEEVFKVAKVGNYFILENLRNKQLCKSVEHKSSRYLATQAGNITEDAKLLLEEPVSSREIYNVVYQTDNPRIYGATDGTRVSLSATNGNAEQTTKEKLSFNLKYTETRTWDRTVSHKAGVSTSMEIGIPKIGLGFTIEFDYEYSKSLSWGTVETKEIDIKVEHEVTVAPMKKMTVTAVAVQAKCDVPFSYTQRDVLYNGEVKMTVHDDGMFTGMNSFDVKFDTKQENLKP